MDIALDEVIHFDAVASSSTGAAVDADSTPTWSIYEEATDTAIQTGNFTKRTSLTGQYRGTATLSAANGFEVGKWYNVTGFATIGGVATKAVVFGPFRVVPAESVAGYPATDAVALHGSLAAAENLECAALATSRNAVNAASGAANTDTAFDTDLPQKTANYYGDADGGLVVAFIAGTVNQYQTRRVVASEDAGGNTRLTLEAALDDVPADADVFVILGRITELT